MLNPALNKVLLNRFSVRNSALFVAASSQYLARTPAASDRQKLTIAYWAKRASLAGSHTVFGQGSGDVVGFFAASSGAGDKAAFRETSGGAYEVVSTATYTDGNWHHFVWAFDTTQATAADRVKLYVDGILITAFDVATYPGASANLTFGQAAAHHVGRRSTIWYYDGRLAEFYYISGKQLDPSAFILGGRPIRYGATFGAADFYLQFQNAASLGDDSLGYGSTWTNNGATQSLDVPV